MFQSHLLLTAPFFISTLPEFSVLNFNKIILVALAATPFFTQHSNAETKPTKGFLGLSVGLYNVLDGDQHSQDIRIEYRRSKPLFKKIAIKPWVGVMGSTDVSLWLGGGLYYDFTLNDQWSLSPSLGMGTYRNGSNDVDLGHAIEFRSQLELAYQLKSNDKVALAFSHFSNAGLGSSNPGVESLSLYYLKSL